MLASTSGLGLAGARALLEEGAPAALGPARLRAREQLAPYGERAWFAELDVTDRAALAAPSCARTAAGS